MTSYLRLKAGGYQNLDTMEVFPDPKEVETLSPDGKIVKSRLRTKAQRDFEKWQEDGGVPDEETTDLSVEITLKEYEVLQVRISWQAAKDEKLSVEAELFEQLQRVRAELNALRAGP